MQTIFRTFLLTLLALALFASPANAANRGSAVIKCSNFGGSVFPGCTIEVVNAGTSTDATLYSDNVGAGTSQANPSTLGATVSSLTIFADDGKYDVWLSGTVPGGASLQITILNGSLAAAQFTGAVSPVAAGGADIGLAARPFANVATSNDGSPPLAICGQASKTSECCPNPCSPRHASASQST